MSSSAERRTTRPLPLRHETARTPLYTAEQRVRRDASGWTLVQGILAPIQFPVFLVSLGLVLRFLATDLVPSAMSSTFSRTGMPDVGDQSRTVMVLAVFVKAIGVNPPLATVTTVLPQ